MIIAKGSQLNGNNHDQNNNLGFKFSSNITDGVSTQTLDGPYKRIFSTYSLQTKACGCAKYIVDKSAYKIHRKPKSFSRI